jgi:hypothetical protein
MVVQNIERIDVPTSLGEGDDRRARACSNLKNSGIGPFEKLTEPWHDVVSGFSQSVPQMDEEFTFAVKSALLKLMRQFRFRRFIEVLTHFCSAEP